MFYFGMAEARNRSTKFKICCATSPTQKRQNCLIALFGTGRKWGSLAMILAGTSGVLRHHGEETCPL